MLINLKQAEILDYYDHENCLVDSYSPVVLSVCIMFVDIRCDTLSTPSNGGMSCSSGREGVGYEGDTCGFTCNTGYELTGSDNRICQSNGSWSGDESVCREGKGTYSVSQHIYLTMQMFVTLYGKIFGTS